MKRHPTCFVPVISDEGLVHGLRFLEERRLARCVAHSLHHHTQISRFESIPCLGGV